MDAEEQYQAGKDKFDLLLDQIVQAMAQGGVSLYPDGDALLAALTSQDPAEAGMAQAAVDQVLSGMRGQLLAGMAQADEQIAQLNETIAQLEAAIDAIENPPVDPDPEPEPEPEPQSGGAEGPAGPGPGGPGGGSGGQGGAGEPAEPAAPGQPGGAGQRPAAVQQF